MALKKFSRISRYTIPDDYIVYLIESDFDAKLLENLITFLQAMSENKFTLWLNVKKNELESIYKN